MMTRRIVTRSVLCFLVIIFFSVSRVDAQSCEKVVHELTARLASSVDEPELIDILRHLNQTDQQKLPGKFVNKKAARRLGWKLGSDLWSVNALKGSSIGGDRFGNREKRLPARKWREADLDYHGGHRGGKRLVFSQDGKRFVTVDHYRSFTEVPPCR